MIVIAANFMPSIRSHSEGYSGMVSAYECLALILCESTNSVVAQFCGTYLCSYVNY